MRRIIIIGFVLLLSLALGSVIMAEEKQAKGKPAAGDNVAKKAEKKEVVKKFSGIAVSFDAATKTLVAKREKTEMTFDLATAKLASNTKLEEIKAGDKIAIKYIEKEGKNVARDVAKAPAKKKE